MIAEGLGSSSSSVCDTQFVAATGGAALYCLFTGISNAFSPGCFSPSPDGTLVAIGGPSSDGNGGTNIYKNGTLVTAVPGGAFEWLDNERLLVSEGPTSENLQVLEPDIFKIYDSLGNLLGNAATTIPIWM